ncbi:MAG: hypothetical protein KBF73_09875, partial [Flavobacteriales bacterium]|nr:hypothetical protein [Flavobacteriales bacterium]
MIAGLLGFRQKVTENVSVFFIGILLTEAILSCTDWTKTQSEKLYNVYVPAENEFNDFKRYYWIDDPHTVKSLHDKE